MPRAKMAGQGTQGGVWGPGGGAPSSLAGVRESGGKGKCQREAERCRGFSRSHAPGQGGQGRRPGRVSYRQGAGRRGGGGTQVPGPSPSGRARPRRPPCPPPALLRRRPPAHRLPPVPAPPAAPRGGRHRRATLRARRWSLWEEGGGKRQVLPRRREVARIFFEHRAGLGVPRLRSCASFVAPDAGRRRYPGEGLPADCHLVSCLAWRFQLAGLDRAKTQKKTVPS